MTSLPGTGVPGVGAGLVIVRDDGNVLLYRRMNAPEAGHWNIVGGKVEFMEHSAEAARREAEEETGLSIGSVQYLCSSEQILHDDHQHWLSLIYLTVEFTGEPGLPEPDKLSEWGWFDPYNPPQPLSRFAADAFRHLANVCANSDLASRKTHNR